LFCKLTKRKLIKRNSVLEKHVNGKRFKRQLAFFEESQKKAEENAKIAETAKNARKVKNAKNKKNVEKEVDLEEMDEICD